MTDLLTLTIDGTEVQVAKGSTVMDACKAAGKEIPHFCYHDRLSVAGNCRMCLVEIEKAPKPVASCHWPAADGMVVKTQSETTQNARKGTMELLLANHPLDCPICDQGGECELQDQAVAFGSDRSHYNEFKRAVDDKDIGHKIKTVMTRCIHCTRCIRFATEIAGVEEFGATGRGENMQVGTYVESALQSELAGNMIDLCPVGALTSAPYTYTARPWELESTKSIDIMDATGSHIRIDSRAGKVMRIVPEECDPINEEWISDTARFSYDALNTNRLTTPLLRKGKELKAVGWAEAFKALTPILKKANSKTKASSIAGLAGDLHSAEDYFAFREFMKSTLKTDNIDARTDGCQVDGTNPAAYVLHTPLKQVETADAVLLIGCNPRLDAPVLNIRLRRAVRKGTMKVYSIGPDMDLTYPHQNKGETSQDIAKMKTILSKAKRPLVLIGNDVLTRKDAKAILAQTATLAEESGAMDKKSTANWKGFGVLQRYAGRVTALDLGIHPTSGGWDFARILKEIKAKKLDVLVQYGDANTTASALQGSHTTVYVGTHLTEQAQQADIILPAAAYTEKHGLWSNTEGRVQQSIPAVKPPHNAKEDWKIFRALSGELENPLPFDTLDQLRKLIAQDCSVYSKIGEIIPADWNVAAFSTKDKMTDIPFQIAITQQNFYQSNELLRQSKTMQNIQAETHGKTAQAHLLEAA